MCGIIGYSGFQSATNLSFNALKKMEYRGYDSAGIAVLDGGAIALQRAEGKLARLEEKLSDLPARARVGIGHTRWATHGEPSEKNAHPHYTPHFALVHNGIIENYLSLKAELLKSGVTFNSETDTEVVVQLLELEKSKHQTMIEALRAVIGRLEGAYALGVLVRDEPERIYIAKHGSPMVLGRSPDEVLFASDVTALGGLALEVSYLQDGDYGYISPAESFIRDRSHNTKALFFEPLNWNAAAIEKAGYRHFMLKEIHEQSSVIANAIQRFCDKAQLSFSFSELGIDKLDLKTIDQLYLVGCGTAYLAAYAAKYLLEPLLQMPVQVELASEFRYRKPYLKESTLVIAISQSGETADTLASLRFAKDQGLQVSSVCNVHHSSIVRETPSSLYMQAGPEIGVASTKAFSSQVFSLYVWGLAVAQAKGLIHAEELGPILDEMHHLPVLIEKAVHLEERIALLSERYYDFPNFLYMGRGPLYPLALEGALKLKEISYIHAEGYASGELKHGPIALVDRNMPIVALVPRDQYYEKSFSNVQEIKARKGQIIGIGDEDNEDLKALCQDLIPLPTLKNPAFQVIISVIPLQLLAYYIAVRRGTDVDQPRNLAKSVTVE